MRLSVVVSIAFIGTFFAGIPSALAQPATAPATQPIAWEKWSDDVFDRAKAQHKLVLLDLEAVWCHWCHVMDETTYRDPATIALIHDHYIAVRVDQDSRPDLSNRYEDYGWPATVVFKWDGSELAKRRGYLEPQAMSTMLKAFWDDPTPGPSIQAEVQVHPSATGALPADLRDALIKRHVESFDTKMAGWGGGYKFLDWDNAEWALSHSGTDAREADMARKSLTAAMKLVDPVWGGVYQYSTDGDWDHPHFEKIMQMQSQYLRIYSLAYARWKNADDLKAAQAIHSFLVNFLRSPEGAFYTSQDADLRPGEHGGEYFALDDAGRRKQGIPRIDTHIYARENGWAIQGLVAYHNATGDAAALDEAMKADAWIRDNRRIQSAREARPYGFVHERQDAGLYLGDNLAMGRADLALYAATGDGVYLLSASALADFITNHFTGEKFTGVATSDLQQPATFKPKAQVDENVETARFANLLWHYTGNAKHRELAEIAMRYLASPDVAGNRNALVAGILLADAETAAEPLHVTVVGSKKDAAAAALLAAALAHPSGYMRIESYDPAEGPLPHADVEYPVLKKPAGFLCTGTACSSPAFDPAALKQKLAKAK
jgi:uncharacterized protein YyaL (SSP411 family)